ncbi:hypothetical protein DHD32_14840 [Arenibacter sp. TNZ]|nr:hypothetical protein [Arenibacter sp. TNZ]
MQIINIVPTIIMTYFAIPILMGKPQSIAGFKQFENAIGLDAGFFHIVTGVSELGLAPLLAIFSSNNNKVIGKLAFTFLLLTMITALGLEFFARPEPLIVLVIISFILALLSLYKLKTLK